MPEKESLQEKIILALADGPSPTMKEIAKRAGLQDSMVFRLELFELTRQGIVLYQNGEYSVTKKK